MSSSSSTACSHRRKPGDMGLALTLLWLGARLAACTSCATDLSSYTFAATNDGVASAMESNGRINLYAPAALQPQCSRTLKRTWGIARARG